MVEYYEYKGLKILELDLSDADTSISNAMESSKKLMRLTKLHRSGDLYILYNIGGYKVTKDLLVYLVHSIQKMKHNTKRRSIIVSDHDQKDRMVAICKALKIIENSKIVETKEQALNWFVHGDDELLNSLIL